MTPDYLPCVEIEPSSPATWSVVWLHGLGADGHDFEPIVPELGLSPEPGVRFVLPHAPAIPVTINMGMVMPAWYDIRDPDLDSRKDLEGLRRSMGHIERLLAREQERGIPPERIVLAGFSQGGAVALQLGLAYPRRLAGILALSTYLLEPGLPEAAPANARTPIFQAHGSLDPMVPLAAGEATREVLAQRGYPVTWKIYPMPHAVCAEEVEDISRWLAGLMKPED